MEEGLALQRILGLLSDEDRFHIAAAVSLGANTVDKIAAMTGLDKSTITKAIIKLEGARVIQKKENTGYSFNIETIKALNRSLDRSVTAKPRLSSLDRFLRDGKITTYPRSRDDQLLVLNYIAALFESGREYPEKEINEKLKTVNPDFASYRRYLIDNGFLERDHATDKGGRTITTYRRIERK